MANGSIKKVLFFFLLFVITFNRTHAQVVTISDENPTVILSKYMEEVVDKDSVSSLEKIIRENRFVKTNGQIPLFPNDVKSAWFRFTVQHNSLHSARVFLNIAYANLSEVTLYKTDSTGTPVQIGKEGNAVISTQHVAGSPNIVFNLQLKEGETKQFLVHVYSIHPIIVPATVLTTDAVHTSVNFQSVVTGLYLGVLAVMLLYNLFLFFATKDNSYVYYVVYIFCLALAQTTLAGYGYRYIWPNSPGLNKYAVIITSSFSAITGLLFSMHFLQTARLAKRSHRLLQVFVAIFVFGVIYTFFTDDLRINYNILNYNSLAGTLFVLATSFYIAKKNFRPAYFYLTAWLFFLITFIILILRNIAVLPYNNFTTYIIYLGSSLEVALLSIALADKINVLRKEKEDSQAQSYQALLENEQLVRNQNSMLERKVAERTEELSSSNTHLSSALQDLKDTQIQLVEAEKMASLGQLTAGIAHEINNPINFVKSNIGPLKMDISDLLSIIDEYDQLHGSDAGDIAARLGKIDAMKKRIDLDYVKKEIDNLVTGIREGAERTAEIVQGLRTFSRLDEAEIKAVNIYDGIDTSIVLLKNMLPANITIEKDYRAKGFVECFPGKLNQVFMNVLGNAIQAIKQKPQQGEKEHIFISTKDIDDRIEIHIRDTGVGMNEETRRKIFDPFFTTKEVGEGTGLGLSIVYKIIQMHEGKIEVISEPGKGAEFIITLHHILPGTTLI